MLASDIIYQLIESFERPCPHLQKADRLAWEVESLDVRIDRLVYELYGLTEDEIKIVEGWA